MSNVITSSLKAVASHTNVHLGGQFSFDKNISIIGRVMTRQTGINIDSKPSHRGMAMIGSYVGNLYVSGTLATVILANAYISHSSTFTIKVQ